MQKTVLIFSSLLAVATNTCFAAESDRNETLELGAKHYYYNYSETIGDSEKAWLNGFHIAYKKQNNQTGNYYKVSYDQTNQNTNYDGFLISTYPVYTTTPYQGITNNKITNYEITLGSSLNDRHKEYVYTGLGVHNWDRNLTGSGGYLEKYSWNYIPVGYRNEHQLTDKWSGALDISLRFMFNGDMSTAYNGGTTSGLDNRFVLGNKIGYKIELPYTYQMTSQLSMQVNPWYEYSGIGQSNVSNGYYEPDSTTHQYGIDLGVALAF